MMLGVVEKQPVERYDALLDFSDWLESFDNDTLLSATATSDLVGLTVDPPIVSATKISQWVSGGEHGNTYKVSVTATTSGGRIKQVEFKVRVREI